MADEKDSKKALAILSQDPELRLFDERLMEIKKHLLEKMRFIEKQAKALAEEADNKNAAVWKEVYDVLERRGVLPKDFCYEKKNYQMTFDNGNDVFVISKVKPEKDSSDAFAAFLKKLFE